MKDIKIRTLRADEIDVRVGIVKEGRGVSFLLYKDARCDMNILDETFGAMNWKREHRRDNQNCIVSVWNESIGEWVSKEDTGTESNTEKEKGLASDSFKRACVNWGIGRELYTAPFIWISGADTQKIKNTKLYVSLIAYDDCRNICKLVLVDNKGVVRYTYGVSERAVPFDAPKTVTIQSKMNSQAVDDELTETEKESSAFRYVRNSAIAIDYYCKKYDVKTIYDITALQWLEVYNELKQHGKL